MKKSATHKKKTGRELEHITKRATKRVFRDVDVSQGRKRSTGHRATLASGRGRLY